MTFTKEGIEIRKVEKEDADWKHRFDAFYADCTAPKHGRKFAHAYFAAYNGKEIVGHSEIFHEGDKWLMDGLRVKTEFRERGIAKALTRARIVYAIENGAKEIWYNCHDDNLMTTCCHVSLGFKKVCPPHHHCTPTTTHWYKLKITKALIARLTQTPGK